MKFIGSFVLGAGAVAAAISFGPDLAARWKSSTPPPISIPDATAQWVSEREFDIQAPGFTWSDTCPSIWVTWAVQTRWNGAVPVTTKAISGPFAARGTLPPRYQIAIEPKVGPPLQIRVTIPDWLPHEDVLLVTVEDIAPDNEPCSSGWSGVTQVFRLQIEPRERLP